jgi:hypothetical protein
MTKTTVRPNARATRNAAKGLSVKRKAPHAVDLPPIHQLYRPGVLELGLRTLAQERDASQASAASNNLNRSEKSGDRARAYFDLETSLREVGHMIGIVATLAHDLLSETGKKLDDGTVTIRMTGREQNQLLFSISKVRDLFEVLEKAYDSGFGRRGPEEGDQ